MADKVSEGRHTLSDAGGSLGPEETFSRVGATLPPGIWVLDRKGTPFAGSPSALSQLRALSGDPIKGIWKEVIGHDEDGHPVTMLVASAPLRNRKGEIEAGLAINMDITKRKKEETDLRRRTEDLIKSNAELEQFARIASHDLQEPLRAIEGYLELLRMDNESSLDERSKNYIESSLKATMRMSNMINDLLVCSRIDAMARPVSEGDMEAALDRALENLKQSIGESGAEITHDKLPKVVSDENQMAALFQNLISNAIKYKGQAPVKIHVSAKKNADEWLFSVKDNGIGIDPNDQDKIFKMFQRLHTKPDRPGTGMGLPICRAIAQRHGGKIWVESELGKGATFYFTISARNSSDILTF